MVPDRPPLEIASAVNKVFMIGLSTQPHALVKSSTEWLTGLAEDQNQKDDDEKEAGATANIDGTGKNRCE